MHNKLYFKKELYRKYIHISSIIIPLLIWYYGNDIMLPFLVTLSIIMPALDYSRRFNKFTELIYIKLFKFVTRNNEYSNLTGASWIFISVSFIIIIFDENIAIISLIILSLSDSFASIVGIRYGFTKLFSKTLEGSVIFFITTSLILITLTSITIIKIIFISITITIVELLSKKINDNLTIPLTASIMLSLFK